MRKPHLLLISILLCFIFSCKKNDVIGGKVEYSKLIVGSWKSYEQHTKIYDAGTNQLLKDTTIEFVAANANQAYYEIFNADGSAYVTTLPYKKTGATVATVDTTTYLHYTILGSNLTLKQNIGGNETNPIISLTSGNMGLENTSQALPLPGWGLDVSTLYTFTVDTYFNKQ